MLYDVNCFCLLGFAMSPTKDREAVSVFEVVGLQELDFQKRLVMSVSSAKIVFLISDTVGILNM